jgi:hypothetical protein
VVIEPGLYWLSPRKREYSRQWLETFDELSSHFADLGVQRPCLQLQKPATGGPFCHYQGWFLGRRDWLAGVAGIEPSRSLLCEEPVAQLAAKLLKGNYGRSSAADEAKM